MLSVAVAADLDAIPPAVRDIYRFPGGDWVGHFVLYGLMAFIGIRAFPRRAKMFSFSLPLAALATACLSALEELSQFWFPTRTPDWRDLSFGLLGILVVAWLSGQSEETR